MPGVRRKIALSPGGPSKDAELIEVQNASEQWSHYILADGSVIRLKPVVIEIWRVIGEYDPEGNPLYVVRSRNVLAVTAPDEMRRQE
jgi:hypothetical protein